MPVHSREEPVTKFPEGFLWGSAISAYQTEGGNTNNQWYVWEKEGGHIKDGSVCGRAADFYHLYEQDLDLAKELGHNTFRFSVEWSRIEPRQGEWDTKEVEHYRSVIKAIKSRGMEPLVTIHHFTNPIWMEAEGGWVNEKSVDHFRRYAEYLALNLGDLFKLWGPINEPTAYASASYMLRKFPPCETNPKKYRTVLRHMLLAHAEAYRCIHDVLGKNRTRTAPKVGTVKDMTYFQPYDEDSARHRSEADFQHRSYNASFLDALGTGTVNPPMGNGERLPIIKDAWDFVGFNYYSRALIGGGASDHLPKVGSPRRKDSLGVSDMGWDIYPQGIYQLIKWLKEYGKPIYITENGIAVHDDNIRSMFIVLHLSQVHKAIKEGANVQAYFYWSLIDNFEWDSGFDKRFGLVEVDYRTLKRTSRASSYVYKEIIKSNGVTGEVLEKYKKLATSLASSTHGSQG